MEVPFTDINRMKKTFCAHDAILTLCDDVTIVFSQISRKKDESEIQKQALCLLLLDAV